MAPNAQLASLDRQRCCFLKPIADSHERGGSYNSSTVRFYNAPVYTGSKPKVVCIDDQPSHGCEFNKQTGLTRISREPYTARAPSLERPFVESRSWRMKPRFGRLAQL